MSDDLPELIRDWPPVVDYLGPCPSWCKGRPHESTSDAPCDQYHVSEIMDVLNVDTERGEYWTLGTEIEWAPFASRPEDWAVVGSVYLDGDDVPVPMTADQIRALADSLAGQAVKLRAFAERLVEAQVEERAARTWRT